MILIPRRAFNVVVYASLPGLLKFYILMFLSLFLYSELVEWMIILIFMYLQLKEEEIS